MEKSKTDAWAEISAKYERAQKHINDLDAYITTFRKANPNSLGAQSNKNTGKARFYVASLPDLPNEISLILGDALQNLRSTLDHLAYKLVEAANGKLSSQTGFPIFDTAKEYTDSLPRKVAGIGQLAKETLDRVEPYKTGNVLLWKLHRLNVIDKHRLLLTISHVNDGRLLTPSEKEKLLRNRSGDSGTTNAYWSNTFLNTGKPPIALKAGDELLALPISELNENMGFSFNIAINEPGVAEGTPLILLLRFMSNEISRIISDFARFL